VKPQVTELAPRTSYDEDLHEPRRDDTYESISKELYHDAKYAAALRAYNDNKPLAGMPFVKVPPTYVLTRKYPNLLGGTGGGAGGRTNPSLPAPSTTPTGANWEAPAARPSGGGSVRYVLPRAMTLKDVARATLGSEQRWNDVYDLNPAFRADQSLPAGSELRLPPDARVPERR
ncbi:MAG: hypothetical protein K2V38_19770, partial [Gemmataceae bacterium]|nr:hypothetical protein [Gemmataceae bacterium]